MFEFAVATIRATLFTTEEDTFQALERDPEVKRRFEEASSEELQQGWDRETNEEKRKEDAVKGVVERLRVREEERREEAVREMLRNRERGEAGVEGDREGEERSAPVIGAEMENAEVDRILSRGYGRVREE